MDSALQKCLRFRNIINFRIVWPQTCMLPINPVIVNCGIAAKKKSWDLDSIIVCYLLDKRFIFSWALLNDRGELLEEQIFYSLEYYTCNFHLSSFHVYFFALGDYSHRQIQAYNFFSKIVFDCHMEHMEPINEGYKFVQDCAKVW